MPNTWITDATHFLDSEGRQVQGRRAHGIVKHIGAIISAVTEPRDGLSGFPVVRCRRRPHRVPCPGTIVADVDQHGGSIVWECPACGDRGMISNWQWTPWDRGERTQLPDVRRVTYVRVHRVCSMIERPKAVTRAEETGPLFIDP